MSHRNGPGRVSGIYYVLNERGEPVLEPDLVAWGRWMQTSGHRIMRQDTIGGYLISTVFLGIDHDFGGKGPPLLWETLVGTYEEMNFAGGKSWGLRDDEMYRHASHEAAQRCHDECVARFTKMATEASDLLDDTLAQQTNDGESK